MRAFLERNLRHRWPWLFVLCWLIVLGVAVSFRPEAVAVRAAEPESLLPASAISERGLRLLSEAFGRWAARSRVVVVAEDENGLSEADVRWLTELSRRLRQICRQNGWGFISPYLAEGVAERFISRKLVSRDGRCALIVVNLPSNFVVLRTIAAVEALQEVVKTVPGRPASLQIFWAGDAVMGRDYAVASSAALDRTTWVTVAALVVILLVVYRAPLAALVPLGSIAVSVVVALRALDWIAVLGWPVSNAERIFAVVLLFGSGTDYALFVLSRYAEALRRLPAREAAFRAVTGAFGGIAGSAGTTVCGLAAMGLAEFLPSRNAGPVLAGALLISTVAALTLVPALAALAGRRLFWPLGSAGSFVGGRTWLRIALTVAKRPGRVLAGGLGVVVVLACTGAAVRFRYDAISDLPADAESVRGAEAVARHFDLSEVSPLTVVIRWPEGTRSPSAREMERLTEKIRALRCVREVYSFAEPLGRTAGPLVNITLRPMARRFFLSREHRTCRFEVLLTVPPFSDEALQAAERILDITEDWSSRTWDGSVEVAATGPTAYMLDVKRFSVRDWYVVPPAVIAVVGLVVLIVVKDVLACLGMLVATVLTYYSALGITAIIFAEHFGRLAALDWKVRLLLFVIIVAVGQDYNIFVISRLLQEARTFGWSESVVRAVYRTGPVVRTLLEELGFALAAGILLDTFVVRPLILPAFYRLAGLRGSKGRNRQMPAPSGESAQR